MKEKSKRNYYAICDLEKNHASIGNKPTNLASLAAMLHQLNYQVIMKGNWKSNILELTSFPANENRKYGSTSSFISPPIRAFFMTSVAAESTITKQMISVETVLHLTDDFQDFPLL